MFQINNLFLLTQIALTRAVFYYNYSLEEECLHTSRHAFLKIQQRWVQFYIKAKRQFISAAASNYTLWTKHLHMLCKIFVFGANKLHILQNKGSPLHFLKEIRVLHKISQPTAMHKALSVSSNKAYAFEIFNSSL